MAIHGCVLSPRSPEGEPRHAGRPPASAATPPSWSTPQATMVRCGGESRQGNAAAVHRPALDSGGGPREGLVGSATLGRLGCSDRENHPQRVVPRLVCGRGCEGLLMRGQVCEQPQLFIGKKGPSERLPWGSLWSVTTAGSAHPCRHKCQRIRRPARRSGGPRPPRKASVLSRPCDSLVSQRVKPTRPRGAVTGPTTGED